MTHRIEGITSERMEGSTMTRLEFPWYVTEADKNRAKIDTLRARAVDPTISPDAWQEHAVSVAEIRREEAGR